MKEGITLEVFFSVLCRRSIKTKSDFCIILVPDQSYSLSACVILPFPEGNSTNQGKTIVTHTSRVNEIIV